MVSQFGGNEPNSSQESYRRDITYKISDDLRSGYTVVGTMFRETEEIDKIGSATCFEEARENGFRIVVIDCEHKAFNQERIAAYAKIAHKIGLSLWLRPTQQDEEAISKYADMGVSGFMVANAIELRRLHKIINQAYFSPIANTEANIRRGYSMGDVVLDGPPLASIEEEMAYVNRNMIVTVQTEHHKGIKNLPKLLSLRGIFGTIIGPNDLAISLSQLPGNQNLIRQDLGKMYNDERMINAYREIGRIASRHGKVAGIHFTRTEERYLVEDLVENMNYRLILLGTEKNFCCPKFLKTKEIIEQIGNSQKSR